MLLSVVVLIVAMMRRDRGLAWGTIAATLAGMASARSSRDEAAERARHADAPVPAAEGAVPTPDERVRRHAVGRHTADELADVTPLWSTEVPAWLPTGASTNRHRPLQRRTAVDDARDVPHALRRVPFPSCGSARAAARDARQPADVGRRRPALRLDLVPYRPDARHPSPASSATASARVPGRRAPAAVVATRPGGTPPPPPPPPTCWRAGARAFVPMAGAAVGLGAVSSWRPRRRPGWCCT